MSLPVLKLIRPQLAYMIYYDGPSSINKYPTSVTASSHHDYFTVIADISVIASFKILKIFLNFVKI